MERTAVREKNYAVATNNATTELRDTAPPQHGDTRCCVFQVSAPRKLFPSYSYVFLERGKSRETYIMLKSCHPAI